MRLIVNGDDFGYTPGINQGIIYCFREGILSSTTLMVNQPFSQEAAELARKCPELGVGLHVNLTKGRPVSSPHRVPSLLEEKGGFQGIDKLYQQNINREEVKTEVFAQIEEFFQLDLKPTHLDAHHHLQFHPVIIETLIEAAKKNKLPLRNVGEETRLRFQKENIPTPDIFLSSFFGEKATRENLYHLLPRLNQKYPGAVVELMTHPGFLDQHITTSSYHSPREKELNILCSEEIRELINKMEIEIVSYSCLAL